jgi:hypothetical protein
MLLGIELFPLFHTPFLREERTRRILAAAQRPSGSRGGWGARLAGGDGGAGFSWGKRALASAKGVGRRAGQGLRHVVAGH